MRRLAALLLLVAPAAADPAARAEALVKEYLSFGKRPDRKGEDRRENILTELKDLPDGAGYGALLRLVPRTVRPVEYMMATLYLGKVRDEEHLRVVVKHADKLGEEAFIRFLGEMLAKDPPDVVRAWILKEGLRSTDPIMAGTSCRAAGDLRMAEAAEPIGRILLRTGRNRKHRRVAYEAARALILIEGMERRLDCASHESPWVRLAAARILPSLKEPGEAALAAFAALARDPSWQVRRQLLRSVGWTKNMLHARALIEALEADPRLAVRATAGRALRDLSGRDLDYDPAAWREWLKDQKAETPPQRTYSFARYYGQAVVADNVCFVVDLSGSMGLPKRADQRRIDVAVRELLKALEQLPEETRFNLVAFSDDATTWRRGAVKATARNVAAARRWVEETFAPGGQTNTHAALKAAFESDDDLDTIFLLSDGSPSVGVFENATDSLHAIYAWEWERQVVIHTIALSLSDLFAKEDKEDWGEWFMGRVASMTDGETRVVARPP